MTGKIVLTRRALLLASAGLAAAPAAFAVAADPFASSSWRKVTDAEWRKRLTPAQYHILRQDGTETPGTSPLNDEHRKGMYVCVACELPLFKSEWKYDPHEGWPSFWNVIKANIRTKADHMLVLEERTEYHCARCLGHQGHVFNDGPRPTGLRYCNDGVALRFIPA